MTTKPVGAHADKDNLVLGIGLMVLGMAVLNAMDAISKLLTIEHAGFQVTWARYFFHLLPMVVFAGPTRIMGMLRTNDLRAQLVRATAFAISAVCIVLAFSSMPLADAIAVTFIAPLIMVAMSGRWLGEQVGFHRWTAVVVGFVGVLILVWPSADVLEVGVLYALAAAVLWAFGQMLTRRVRTDNPWSTLFYTALIGTGLTSLAAPFFWTWPTAQAWGLMVVMGLLGGTAHTLLIHAFARASASLLAPFNYTLLLWALLYGWLLFDDLPGPRMAIGALVIVAAGLYAWHRERAAARG
ncbi:MAG: DMT family transporter [Alphaproteobacteria bacterium]